eukprot:scpid108418/ scgid12707/ 
MMSNPTSYPAERRNPTKHRRCEKQSENFTCNYTHSTPAGFPHGSSTDDLQLAFHTGELTQMAQAATQPQLATQHSAHTQIGPSHASTVTHTCDPARISRARIMLVR